MRPLSRRRRCGDPRRHPRRSLPDRTSNTGVHGFVWENQLEPIAVAAERSRIRSTGDDDNLASSQRASSQFRREKPSQRIRNIGDDEDLASSRLLESSGKSKTVAAPRAARAPSVRTSQTSARSTCCTLPPPPGAPPRLRPRRRRSRRRRRPCRRAAAPPPRGASPSCNHRNHNKPRRRRTARRRRRTRSRPRRSTTTATGRSSTAG